jgi:putative DNA primase/helicase
MMPEEVAARIGQGRERRSGNGWMAPCPAHDDRTASCSISEGDDGRTLVKCFAGCDTEAVLAERNLTMSDLFPERPRDDRPRISDEYAYLDEVGTVLFEVIRYEPKGQFPLRTPDGRGGWTWKLNGARLVPYRLPELMAAAKAGSTVFVAEGEKDCLAIVRAGETATTSPMGAGKWRDEYAEYFVGVGEVVIVADRDRAGYRHARDVARSLTPVVGVVRLCGSGFGKDAADHLAAGLSLAELDVITSEELEQLCADVPVVADRPADKSVANVPPLSDPDISSALVTGV